MLQRHSPFYLMNILLHNAVYIMFILYAFKSKVRRSFHSVICWSVLYVIFSCVIILLFLEQEAPLPQYAVFAQVAWISATVLFCVMFLKHEALQMCFLILVTINIQNNVIAIAKIISSFKWFPRFQAFEAGSYLLLTVGVLALYLPFIWLIFVRLFKRVIDTGVDYAYWKYLWIIPAAFIILMHSSTLSGITPRAYSVHDLITLFFLNIASVSAYIVSLQMLIRTHDSMSAIERANLMTKQIALQKEAYKRLMARIKETSVQSHDWRHHMLAIEGLIKSGAYKKLEAYMRELMDGYKHEIDTVFCENAVVSVILRHFVSQARERGIETEVNVHIPDGLAMPDLDLCVVFGNIIENAIEACSRQKDGRRFITIQSAIVHKQLLLSVENSFSGSPEQADGVFKSTKREGEGFGLSSVKSIAEASSGCLITEFEEGVFTTKVLVNIP